MTFVTRKDIQQAGLNTIFRCHHLIFRAPEEVHADVSTVHMEEEGKAKCSQLSRRNSSKNLVCTIWDTKFSDMQPVTADIVFAGGSVQSLRLQD